MNVNHILRSVAVIGSLLALGACATGPGPLDPYATISHGYTTVGDAPLTPEKVNYQDKVVAPRCNQYAKETVPNKWVMGGAYAINHGVAGFASGAVGYMAETHIIGVAAGPQTVLAVGAATGINAGAQAGVSGMEQSDALRYNKTDACLTNDVLGIHQIPPSVGRRIAAGKQPATSFGAPAQWGADAPPPEMQPAQ
jgi:hypothetical protein